MARFKFRFWEPPKISDNEKTAIGKLANDHGISLLILRFMHLPMRKVFDSGITMKQLLEYWSPMLVYAGLVAFGVSLSLLGEFIFRSKDATNVGEALWAVGLIGLFVFSIFYFLSLINYYLWLKKLMDFSNRTQ